MATIVETFFVEETTNLIQDNEALAKWNEKVEELELHGQRTVVKIDKSPIPFLWMNSSIISTFEVLCPTQVDISNYDKTPIPVELLDIVSLCKKDQYFDLIEVWYNEKQKDPVIVGYCYDAKEGQSDWVKKFYAKKYLIGRWADVKASIDQLVERARRLFFNSETVRLKQEIRDRQRNLEDLETAIDTKFGGAMPSTDLPF